MTFMLFLTTKQHQCHHRYPVELPKTIKLVAGGSSVGTISVKPARYYRKLLYGILFDSSSTEDEDDPEVASVAAKNIDDDNQHVAQSGDTSNDADSASYGLEHNRATSNMGTHKHINRNMSKLKG